MSRLVEPGASFHGHAPEQNRLLELLDDARSGRSGAAVVVGEPGAGANSMQRRSPSFVLEPLDTTAVEAILTTRAGAAVAPDVARRVASASGGNALAVVELAPLRQRPRSNVLRRSG